MITPANNHAATPVPPNDPRRARAASADQSAALPESDTLDTSRAETLRATLAATPEIRAEVVERAARLAVDPNYPPREIIDQIARQIVLAQDPSNNLE